MKPSEQAIDCSSEHRQLTNKSDLFIKAVRYRNCEEDPFHRSFLDERSVFDRQVQKTDALYLSIQYLDPEVLID